MSDESKDDDFTGERLINVMMPRKDYELLKQVIDQQRTSNYFKSWFKTHIVWVLLAGMVSIAVLYDKITGLVWGIK